ncbi:hypothetical protein VNO77_25127 [Canavalia gladiata]|uniref:Uncharacterized protein n=1 Tax=Canavalia gladiata TaxID=3824 RepID=A0AAN9QD72_CANGL
MESRDPRPNITTVGPGHGFVLCSYAVSLNSNESKIQITIIKKSKRGRLTYVTSPTLSRGKVVSFIQCASSKVRFLQFSICQRRQSTTEHKFPKGEKKKRIRRCEQRELCRSVSKKQSHD